MSDEQRMKLIKNTSAYVVYDLRLAVYDLFVAITDSFGKNNWVSNALQSKKTDTQRMQNEYVAELMSD